MSFTEGTEPIYKFWGFTAVIYTKGDPLSFFLSVVSLVPLIFIIMLLTVGVLRPSKRLAFLLTSMAFNFSVSAVLKSRVFRQMRPEHPWALAGRTDYGMPSSHSQFMSYLWMAAAFSAIDYAKEKRWMKGVEEAAARVQQTGNAPSPPADDDTASSSDFTTKAFGKDTSTPGSMLGLRPAPKASFAAPETRRARYQHMKLYKAKDASELMARRHGQRLVGLFLLTLLVMYSRVYGVFHTTAQVWAGFGFGLLCAYVFYRVPLVRIAIDAVSDNSLYLLLKLGHEVFVKF